jgi:hypothetical protein
MANNQAMANNNQAGPSRPREPSLKEQNIEQHFQEHGDVTGAGSLLLLVTQAKAMAEEEKQAANAEEKQAANAELQDRLDAILVRLKKKRKNGEGEDGQQQAQEAEVLEEPKVVEQPKVEQPKVEQVQEPKTVYEQATIYADHMMEDRTDSDVEDFLEPEDSRYREWSQEDWDEWNDGTSLVTDRDWAWYVFYKDFLEDRGLFC